MVGSSSSIASIVTSTASCGVPGTDVQEAIRAICKDRRDSPAYPLPDPTPIPVHDQIGPTACCRTPPLHALPTECIRSRPWPADASRDSYLGVPESPLEVERFSSIDARWKPRRRSFDLASLVNNGVRCERSPIDPSALVVGHSPIRGLPMVPVRRVDDVSRSSFVECEWWVVSVIGTQVSNTRLKSRIFRMF